MDLHVPATALILLTQSCQSTDYAAGSLAIQFITTFRLSSHYPLSNVSTGLLSEQWNKGALGDRDYPHRSNALAKLPRATAKMWGIP